MVRKAYLGTLGLLMLAIALQFYFAGIGAFAKPQTDSSYSLHRIDGLIVIPAVSLLATITGLLAKVPRKLVVMSILPGLLIMAQILINNVGGHDDSHVHGGKLAILGLHVMMGMAIMLVARGAFVGARALLKQPAEAAEQEPPAKVGTKTNA